MRVRCRHRPSGTRDLASRVRHVFLFLGAEPATEWLKDCGVELDDKGFVRTGADVVSPAGGYTASAHETEHSPYLRRWETFAPTLSSGWAERSARARTSWRSCMTPSKP